ncbi:cardiolipin synthase [Agilicoccus flavus]|uniref:cardiolipin synthase n=1 Tax=Agilicoccus flavus TaxID=2775968 RepID=UPI001CF6BDFE|nr:cardiolipin synthase [Agilicoccus flavus]
MADSTLLQTVQTSLLVLDYVIKIVAVGVVPENRRPSSSTAWLLLILLVPIVGLPLFLLLGSPYVNRRRHEIQAEANATLDEGLSHLPDIPAGIEPPPRFATIPTLNRHLTSMPCVTGDNHGLHSDYEESIAAMAAAVDRAQDYVHAEIYIAAWDETTDVFFRALERARARGVEVRFLFDHIGSIKYRGFAKLGRRLTAAGIDWHYMLPIQPWRGRFRRVDLRNHRKLLVVDGEVGFMGSQNMIEAAYLTRANQRSGRRWNDVMIELSGPVVAALEAVFAVDWYTESGERLSRDRYFHATPQTPVGGKGNVFQVVPSGPGFTTEPNLRLFTSLVYRAQRRLSLVSPYFVPDESILAAVTTAAYRGVSVELFVSEQADQFMVDHAQSSYYQALLDAGVRIYRLPKPAVLHTKCFVVDDEVGVVGSSNMDMRSFGLNFEISLMGFGGNMVDDLGRLIDGYRDRCVLLTQHEWNQRSWLRRYVDNAMRLTSALQ